MSNDLDLLGDDEPVPQQSRAKPPLRVVGPDADDEDLGNMSRTLGLEVSPRSGTCRKSPHSLATILDCDPRWRDRFAWCRLLQSVVWVGPPVGLRGRAAPRDPTEREVTEQDVAQARVWLDRVYGLDWSGADIYGTMDMLARKRQIHPFLDQVSAVTWDGVARVATFCQEYLGVHDDDEYLAIVSRVLLLGLMSRVCTPGAKLDDMVILEGATGARKSTALAAIAGRREWFSDTRIDLASKDAYGALRGILIYEWAELDGFIGKDSARVKAFLSSANDRYRPPYAKAERQFPRVSIITGTTNETGGYLDDPTGLRRFWPVTIANTIDIDRITRDHGQIWAEALHRVRAGEVTYATREEATEWHHKKDVRSQGDPWLETIRKWLAMPSLEPVYGDVVGTLLDISGGVTIPDVMTHALAVPLERQSKDVASRVARQLRQLGWSRCPWADKRAGLLRPENSRAQLFRPTADWT